MLLGVVSDTHGHVPLARQAVRMLESLEVERVIHCGDVGTPEIIELFGRWPTHFVQGNTDYDIEGLRETAEAAGQFWHGAFGELEIEGRKIAVLHSDDRNRFLAVIKSGEFDLVCYGHTHLAEQHKEGKTLVLNPGALFRANPHSLAVVELPQVSATIVTL